MEDQHSTHYETAPKPQIEVQLPSPTSQSRNSMNPLLLLGGILLLLAVGTGGYYLGLTTSQKEDAKIVVSPQPQPAEETEIPCTLDAKMCPDGSSVGRVGPYCDFAECPEASSTTPQNWKVYKSSHYPYQISYPEGFVYSKLDAGEAGYYQGYIENANFQKTGKDDSKITSIHVNVFTGHGPYEANLNFVYDHEPTGTYPIDGIEGVVGELPNGYGDGARTTQPPPLLAVQFLRGEAFYKITFEGISSINDPLAKQILDSFKFTE